MPSRCCGPYAAILNFTSRWQAFFVFDTFVEKHFKNQKTDSVFQLCTHLHKKMFQVKINKKHRPRNLASTH